MTREEMEAVIRRELTGCMLAASQRGLTAATDRMNKATTTVLAACDRYSAADATTLRAALARSDTPYNQAERRAVLTGQQP